MTTKSISKICIISVLLLVGSLMVFPTIAVATNVTTNTDSIFVNNGINTLESISLEINDPSVMTYDSINKIAVVKSNLYLTDSTLLIDNETAIFGSNNLIEVNYNENGIYTNQSTMKISNSNITSLGDRYSFVVRPNSIFEMSDSELHNVGWENTKYNRGLIIQSDNSLLDSNRICQLR